MYYTMKKSPGAVLLLSRRFYRLNLLFADRTNRAGTHAAVAIDADGFVTNGLSFVIERQSLNGTCTYASAATNAKLFIDLYWHVSVPPD